MTTLVQGVALGHRSGLHDPAPLSQPCPGGPSAADLTFELTALLAERDALVIAAARADLQVELAMAGVDTARARYDAAVALCKEASTTAAAARRALSRHDAAIAEVRAELRPDPIA